MAWGLEVAGTHKRTGPTTPAGKRRAAGNATKHGAWGLALALAGQYADAVAAALGEKFPDPEFFKTGAGKPAPAPAAEKGIRQPDTLQADQHPDEQDRTPARGATSPGHLAPHLRSPD